jgi:hypothetical protein
MSLYGESQFDLELSHKFFFGQILSSADFFFQIDVNLMLSGGF